jgi:dihydrofolate reductase
MGRRMFTVGEDPWGDDPPFGMPVFIVTHRPRERVTKEGGTTYTFVTDGIEAALQQAREAAGDKDVAVAGGADLAQQYLNAGLLDELQIHLVPLLLGGGVRLFERPAAERLALEVTRVIASPAVTHLRYRVVK